MNTPKLILAECRNWFEDVHPLVVVWGLRLQEPK